MVWLIMQFKQTSIVSDPWITCYHLCLSYLKPAWISKAGSKNHPLKPALKILEKKNLFSPTLKMVQWETNATRSLIV